MKSMKPFWAHFLQTFYALLLSFAKHGRGTHRQLTYKVKASAFWGRRLAFFVARQAFLVFRRAFSEVPKPLVLRLQA